MSWGEVFKINSNLKKPLNEQMRNLAVLQMRIITANMTYTPEKTGIYMVICVGEGGDADVYGGGTRPRTGSGGGVAIKTMRLLSTQSYNVTVSGTSSFGTSLSATAGANLEGAAGTGSGGDYNYTGSVGQNIGETYNTVPKAGSVGVSLVGLTTFLQTSCVFSDGTGFSLPYGSGLLGYGGGGTSVVHKVGSTTESYKQMGQSGAVIIIPLEMEA